MHVSIQHAKPPAWPGAWRLACDSAVTSTIFTTAGKIAVSVVFSTCVRSANVVRVRQHDIHRMPKPGGGVRVSAYQQAARGRAALSSGAWGVGYVCTWIGTVAKAGLRCSNVHASRVGEGGKATLRLKETK